MNLLTWRKTFLGTRAGTAVLCTQYPARVTIELSRLSLEMESSAALELSGPSLAGWSDQSAPSMVFAHCEHNSVFVELSLRSRAFSRRLPKLGSPDTCNDGGEKVSLFETSFCFLLLGEGRDPSSGGARFRLIFSKQRQRKSQRERTTD